MGIVRGVSYGLFGEPGEFVPAARSVGGKAVRVYIYWSQVEPNRDVFDWSVVDALLEQIDAGTEAWVTVCSSSTWGTRTATDFQPPSPALDDAAYERFVEALVRRCVGRVGYWQCNNEPSNSGLSWAGDADEYLHQLRLFARAVRTVDPDARVVLGGCGHDVLSSEQHSDERKFFDTLAQHGKDSFDLFSVHLYGPVDAVPGHIETVRAMMRRHGYERPVVVGEYGGPTFLDFPAATQMLQQAMIAAWGPGPDRPVDMSTGELARQIAEDAPDRRALRDLYARRDSLPAELRMFMAEAPRELGALRDRLARRQVVQRVLPALAAGIDLVMYWNLAPEIAGYTDHLNIMDLMFGRLALMDFVDGRLGAPRPAAQAHRLLAALLEDVTGVYRYDDVDADIRAYRIEYASADPAWAVWVHHDNPLDETATEAVTLPWNHSAAGAVDAFGVPAPVKLGDGGVELDACVTPVFVLAEPAGS